MKSAPIISLVLLLAVGAFAQAPDTRTSVASTCTPTVTGDLQVRQVTSKIFNNTRNIRVLLPPGYNDPANKDRHYPVLYLLDGQNLFDACLSDVSHKEWGVDETVYRLISEKKIPAMIVVGVDHAGEKRGYEYLPYKDFVGNPDMPEPDGKQFPDFLVNEVMPAVDNEFRTLRGFDNTGLGGSSYGGVATLYALMAKPQYFGFALIESPVMWVGMGQLVRDTEPFIAMPHKIFMAFGTKEFGTNPHAADKMISLIHLTEKNIREAGYGPDKLRVFIEDGAAHNEGAWAKRLPDALTFLFGEWKEPTARPSSGSRQ